MTIAFRALPAALALACSFLLAACASGPGVDVSPVRQAPQATPLPQGWEHGAFMEVFVRSYQDSNGDGIGDLRGLTQRLDYLQALGIKGLWLMPVFPAPTATSATPHRLPRRRPALRHAGGPRRAGGRPAHALGLKAC